MFLYVAGMTAAAITHNLPRYMPALERGRMQLDFGKILLHMRRSAWSHRPDAVGRGHPQLACCAGQCWEGHLTVPAVGSAQGTAVQEL